MFLIFVSPSLKRWNLGVHRNLTATILGRVFEPSLPLELDITKGFF